MTRYRGIFFWQCYYLRWHNSVRWLTVEAFLAGAFITVGLGQNLEFIPMIKPLGHRQFLDLAELKKPRKLEGWPLRVNDRREDCTQKAKGGTFER